MFELLFVCSSNTGEIRQHNEDNFYLCGKYLDIEHHNSELLKHKCLTTDNPIVGVFDGMGGENCGELASYIAVNYLDKYKKNNYFSKEAISKLYNDINKEVIEQAKAKKINTMGSTATMLCFQDDDCFISNVGDSPAFLIRNETITEISKAHTDEDLYGKIEGRKAKLTQYLGLEEEYELEPHIEKIEIKSKDKILICSDGLTDMVSVEEINEIVSNNKIEKAIDKLTDKAIINGGVDNITIILCEIIKAPMWKLLWKLQNY